jgi:recombination protein RecT
MNTTAKQITPFEEIRHSLTKMESQFQAALPAHIKPEKFIRVACTAIQTNPNLLKANRTSLYASCTKAAQDGLLPDGREAALVTFGDQVQYMPMIAGVLKKLRNSGELSSIATQIIYEKDVKEGKFNYWIDSDGEHIDYRPDMFADRGQIIGAFAMAKLTDGALYVSVMTKAEIEKVRNVSRAKSSGPWVQWWDQMAEKTVLRRLSKRLPMSTDIDGLFGDDHHDEEVVGVGQQQAPRTAPEMRDVTPEPEPEQPKRQSRAQAAVAAKKTPPPPAAEEPPLYDGPDGEIIDGETGEVYGGDGYADDSVGGPVSDDEIPI